MKNLTGLIKNSVNKNNSITNEHSESIETNLADKIFDLADKITDSFESKKENNKPKVIVKNITFSLPIDTEDKLNLQLMRYMKKVGKPIYKSHILTAAINFLSSVSDEELVKLVSDIKSVEMGRPKK